MCYTVYDGHDTMMPTIIAVEHDWVKTFVLLPHITVSRRWVWLQQVYVRRLWISTGLHVEPETQYADLFDILSL